jgi:hypothetical protein
VGARLGSVQVEMDSTPLLNVVHGSGDSATDNSIRVGYGGDDGIETGCEGGFCGVEEDDHGEKVAVPPEGQFHHFVFARLKEASDRDAEKYACAKCLKWQSSYNNAISLKWFVVVFMCIYIMSELALGVAIFNTFFYENYKGSRSEKYSIVVNILLVLFEFGLLAASTTSMYVWYYRMKGKLLPA